MHINRRHKLAAAGATVLAACGATGAVAATQSTSTHATARRAYLSDAAGRLHVSPQELQSALRAARKDHPEAFRTHRGGRGHQLQVAASYLGLTRKQLIAQLRSGKTLAQVATAQGKSVSGLENALIQAAEKRLNRAVAEKRITTQRRAKMEARLPARINRLVNRTWPRLEAHHG